MADVLSAVWVKSIVLVFVLHCYDQQIQAPCSVKCLPVIRILDKPISCAPACSLVLDNFDL